jgi:hypothetical protein
MSHGGSRPGAGRKPGAANKMSQAAREAAAASGITPLDFFLLVMRDKANDLDTRMDAAKAAAPYVHPRLAAVVHSVHDAPPENRAEKVTRDVKMSVLRVFEKPASPRAS